MRTIFLILLAAFSISLNAQNEIKAKNLPAGIQLRCPIEGHDNLVYVEKSQNHKLYQGVYDINGKEVVPCAFKLIFANDYGLEVEDFNGNCGVFDYNGKKVVPCDFKDTHSYKYGISVQDVNGNWGAYDYNGNVILKPIYKCMVTLDEEGGYLNIGGVSIEKFSVKGGKWGFCNEKGKIIVPCNYDGCDTAGEGLYAINLGGESVDGSPFNIKGGKWGLYGGGREILPCIYDAPPVFKNGVASLKKDGEIRLIKNPLKDPSQIQIAENMVVSKKKQTGGPAVSRYPAPNSDVDKNIPLTKQKNENMFAFIIANENYPDAPVPYSLNDGRIFREYCQKALGLPEKNINMFEDATYGNMIAAVEKIKSISEAFDGEASVIFYYAGHGFPDEKKGTAYLLPIDGDASDITTTGYSLAKLYNELASLKLKLSVVFLDACFSGAKREDEMLTSSRGVAIEVKEEVPMGNMVVFSAAQGDETAHQLEEKGHGLFTYYLLKQLQQTNGNVTLGELSDYVIKQVKRQSVVINDKKQTPTVIPSQAVINNWQGITLK